jgi:hypothetical protein
MICAAVAGAPRWGEVGLGALAIVAIVDGARWASGGASTAANLDLQTWIPAVLATVALLIWGPGVWTRLDSGRRRIAVLAACGVLIPAGIAAGYEVQKRFNDDRYLGFDPAVDYVVERTGPETRIGITGVWDDQGISPVLPAFGIRLESQVEYVGELMDGFLRRYSTPEALRAALARGDYDYLVVGLGRPEAPRVPELAWARAAGFTRVAVSDRLAVLRPS